MRPAELQLILDDQDLSQKGLAELLGVSPHTPMRWLAGSAPIPVATALLLRCVEGSHVTLEQLGVIRRLWEAD